MQMSATTLNRPPAVPSDPTALFSIHNAMDITYNLNLGSNFKMGTTTLFAY
jgi:hypothetical protein